ncbi:PREDICTED: uncharacterized protein LOC105147629 isoform X2 [Acromyrmex echinatior]|uniref:uncharacterized protein LOC105147629 isoform X2 n=1 Tax=Acromyrmex echinatior TaxID=103372 RepID=UPI000580D16C|nr:PREDICTED: uncharacterized protein LOC105147629 isoform X2 [Acromyrmex echinatior]
MSEGGERGGCKSWREKKTRERQRGKEGRMNRTNDVKEDLLDWMTEYRSHGRPFDQDLRDDTLFLYASRIAEIFPLRKRPDDEIHLRAPAMQPRCISEDRAINRTRRLLWTEFIHDRTGREVQHGCDAAAGKPG